MAEPQYQISSDLKFGRWLIRLSKGKVVEIGTWWGMGSTACLMDGISENGGHLWTVEQSLPHVEHAKKIWRSRFDITIIHGHTRDVIDQLPQDIDLLLLDGGEWSTDEEFDILSPSANMIALDDTMRRKNQRQRDIMINSNDWEILVDDTEERNGFLIGCRR